MSLGCISALWTLVDEWLTGGCACCLVISAWWVTYWYLWLLAARVDSQLSLIPLPCVVSRPSQERRSFPGGYRPGWAGEEYRLTLGEEYRLARTDTGVQYLGNLGWSWSAWENHPIGLASLSPQVGFIPSNPLAYTRFKCRSGSWKTDNTNNPI